MTDPCPAFEPHDHSRCGTAAIAAVEAACADRGLRLTPLRRHVLEALLGATSALGAYDVMAALRATGRQVQPPAAYRALDFLVANGFAHRVESLNAFVACPRPADPHRPALLVCRSCRTVAERPGAPHRAALAEDAADLGFAIEALTVEAQGLCPTCRAAA